MRNIIFASPYTEVQPISIIPCRPGGAWPPQRFPELGNIARMHLVPIPTVFCMYTDDNNINAMDSSKNPVSVAPFGPILQPSIKRPKAPDLKRDQRRDIRLFHSIDWSYKQIQDHLPFKPTFAQIRYACLSVKATPTKRSGRPPVLTQAQIEELVEFVCASIQNRRMSFQKLAEVLDFGIKKQAIRSALLREGFHRRLAMRKPPISEKNRQLRLQ